MTSVQRERGGVEQMDEYISKQFVLDYLNGYLHSIGEYNLLTDIGQRRALTNAIQDISAIKAADVQPVIHSRWISTGDGTYNAYCENCGQERGSKSWNKNDFKYCFGCGARMDGDTNE